MYHLIAALKINYTSRSEFGHATICMGIITHKEELDFLDSAGAELLRHFATTTPNKTHGRDSLSELFDEIPHAIKKSRKDQCHRSSIDAHVSTDNKVSLHSDTHPASPIPSANEVLDNEINAALLSVGQLNSGLDLDPEHSPFSSLAEDATRESSVFGEEYDDQTKPRPITSSITHVDYTTIASIKESMQQTLTLNLLYTALKATYLKLCHEFNYLLEKFNENERVKLALISENNELRELLTQIVKEREMERMNQKHFAAESIRIKKESV